MFFLPAHRFWKTTVNLQTPAMETAMPSKPDRRVTRNKRHARVETAESANVRVITPRPSNDTIKVSKPTTIKILFLAANPTDTDTLKIDREIKLSAKRFVRLSLGTTSRSRSVSVFGHINYMTFCSSLAGYRSLQRPRELFQRVSARGHFQKKPASIR